MHYVALKEFTGAVQVSLLRAALGYPIRQNHRECEGRVPAWWGFAWRDQDVGG
jgi:hypothetical protein